MSKTFTPMQDKVTRIIGIDPGYDRLGVAVLEGNRTLQKIIFTDCLTSNKKASFPERLADLGIQLSKILQEHQPTAGGLETLFMNKNVKTALGVAEARGMVLYVLQTHGVKIFEYSPQAVKLAVTGYGKSSKGQVEDMVKRLLPAMKKNMLDDEYDATAVGICTLASERF